MYLQILFALTILSQRAASFFPIYCDTAKINAHKSFFQIIASTASVGKTFQILIVTKVILENNFQNMCGNTFRRNLNSSRLEIKFSISLKSPTLINSTIKPYKLRFSNDGRILALFNRFILFSKRHLLQFY